MSETLRRLDDAVKAGIAGIGPAIEQAVITDGIKEGLEKRKPLFVNALAVLRKLRAERGKIKADMPQVRNEDGTVRQEAGWSDKQLKARGELDQKIKTLSDAIDTVSLAQMASEPDGAKIAELYQKLSQITDKVSKGASGGNSGGESDGA